MFYTDDPIRDFERHDANREAELKKRPVCEHCGEHITDDCFYKINDCKVCFECLVSFCDDNCKVNID